MSEFRIGRTDSRYLSLRILGRAYHDRDDWEANWLIAEVEIGAGGFRGRFGANFLAGEVSSLRHDLSRLYAFDSREAAFNAYDGQLAIQFKGDGLGNFTAECDALDEGSSRLIFSLSFDQTEIPAILKGLDAVLKEYPLTGKDDI
jgi:hypothetical protein